MNFPKRIQFLRELNRLLKSGIKKKIKLVGHWQLISRITILPEFLQILVPEYHIMYNQCNYVQKMQSVT